MTPADRQRRTAALVAARTERGQAPTIQRPELYLLLGAVFAAHDRQQVPA